MSDERRRREVPGGGVSRPVVRLIAPHAAPKFTAEFDHPLCITVPLG